MNTKLTAVVAAAVIVVAAIGVALYAGGNANDDKDDDGDKKKVGGLYALDAQIIGVDMGGITATPKMVTSIEDLYRQVYGDTIKSGFTIEDARSDSDFWDEYCDYDPIVTVGEGGAITVLTSSKGYDEKYVTLSGTADKMLSMGTMYMTTLYYFICQKYGVEPYSDAAENSAGVKADFQKIVAGGTDLVYVEGNTELIEYFDAGTYLDAGQHTIGDYELETLASNVAALAGDGSDVVLIATGKSVDADRHDSLEQTVKAQGGMDVLFITASTIKDSWSNIEALGYIFGFGEQTDDLIEGLQVRLYAVYKSLEDQTEEHKVYWESSTGSTVRASGMSKSIMDFMGWNTTLLGSGEVDTETLLSEKPDILIYYTNDLRPLDEKMRYH